MAVVTIPDEQRTISESEAVRTYLLSRGIDYERCLPQQAVRPDAPPEALLAAYATTIADLKARGGYVTADIIDVTSQTPGLEAMLAKFNSEHWHDEDEVRLIIDGRGLFHINSEGGPVFAIEVGPGDLIRVPRGTPHWFDLCVERRIRAIRLFQNPAGWTPHYTQSGVDRDFQPVCFGPSYVSAASPHVAS
jgi:1,2-dihydroxy-3-keto-5-methylthiopentene dioxygenase